MGIIATDTIVRANRDEMKIEHLISINEAILMVYCINTASYKYEIAFDDGSLYSPNELYYTADQALKVGMKSIRMVIGY